ncbi:SpoIID/LytB domain-containing protein [Bacillus songklensis]|uniref:SpoIID/LytB domain-containing protein n=1 Tax=Bacillus songklensis TaxID=1069116 RepID=A0ABV8B848_9BACI
MKKWLPLLLMLIMMTIFPSSSFAASSGLPFAYKTEVKVRLLQKPTFSASLTGTYSLMDLNGNKLIPLNGQNTISFQQQNGQITATFGTQTVNSSLGFAVYETTISDGNQFKITGMETASGSTDGTMTFRGSFTVKPDKDRPLVLNVLDMENYLKGVVPSEMPALWHAEAVKAQAVVARGYAYTDVERSDFLEMTIASQVYKGKTDEHPNSTKAVLDTAGIYVTYGGKPVKTYFYSSSGGKTENAEDVWGNPAPYIRSVEDGFDRYQGNTHYGWEKVVPTSTIAQKLSLPSTQMLLSLEVACRTEGGNAKQVIATIYDKTSNTLSTKQIFGTSVKYPDAYRGFFGGLKSSKFSVSADASSSVMNGSGTIEKTNYLVGYKIQKADGTTEHIEDLNIKVRTKDGSSLVSTYPTNFTFKGDGYGHGAGLSQWGARGMAEAGYKYDAILKHYYTGVEVKKLY